ncbi:MAG: hypothetical protein K5895_02115 [Lachnospiraceae bacterium]|nr:hypothetical protein [Lachnospiraceae bacterium]
MSGEAGGAIIGGALILSVIPVVIAGAAVVGVGVATVKVVSTLGKYGVEAAQKRQYEKQLTVDRCSSEMSSLYTQISSIATLQTQTQKEFIQKLQMQFSELQSDLDQFKLQKPDTLSMRKKALDVQQKIRCELNNSVKSFKQDVIQKNSARISDAINNLSNNMNKTMHDLKKIHEATLATTESQMKLAQVYMQDAQASLELLHRIQNNADSDFHKSVLTMERIYDSALQSMSSEAYQAAISSAMTVVTKSALIISQHVQEQQEADFLRSTLLAQYEGLKAEMESRRIVEFTDPARAEGKQHIHADLDKFSQGKYGLMLEKIQNLINVLSQDSADRLSIYEIQRLVVEFENETEPEARRIIDFAIRVMGGYFERVDSLNVIADFMNEQGYSMSWAMPEGSDPSQKIIVEFHQDLTGNDICVTLDYDPSSEELTKMVMEVLTYYGNGSEVTEKEKDEMRKALVQALSTAGLSGNLACTGLANQSAPQQTHPTKQSVKNLKPKSLI